MPLQGAHLGARVEPVADVGISNASQSQSFDAIPRIMPVATCNSSNVLRLVMARLDSRWRHSRRTWHCITVLVRMRLAQAHAPESSCPSRVHKPGQCKHQRAGPTSGSGARPGKERTGDHLSNQNESESIISHERNRASERNQIVVTRNTRTPHVGTTRKRTRTETKTKLERTLQHQYR